MPAKSTRKPEFNDEFKKLIQAVLDVHDKETSLATELVYLFRAMGKKPKQEESIDGGNADIYIPDCNVIVECKAPGLADPNKLGSQRARKELRTQKDQLFSYVIGMSKKKQPQSSLLKTSQKPWIGILTDGQNWWAWKWSQDESDTADLVSRFNILDLGVADAFERITNLLFIRARQGKPPPPEEPAAIFKRWEIELKELYEDAEEASVKGLDLKYELWLDILKASGMAPKSNKHRKKLFVQHSHLVVLCKAIISSLESDTFLTSNDPPTPKELLKGTYGGDFTSWILEAKGGEAWIRTLTKKVDTYDWRADTTDVLRRVYESLIDPADRKAYGEYYTPDWLAEMLAERILDEDWIESAVKAALDSLDSSDNLEGGKNNLKGIGVLDPSCGSGSFLYHAARRILTAKTFEELECDPQERANCVARLVHGLDIHPVAVEMARATLLRALPAKPQSELSIHQGDSLLLASASPFLRADDSLKRVYFPNAENSKFDLPKEVVVSSGFNALARDMVKSVIRKKATLPAAILERVEKPYREDIKTAYKDLSAAYAEKGNSIWVWLMVNMVAPYRLSETKVNRILANPPWVRMSDIPDVERKEVLKSMAEKLNLWIGGKQATSMDIAAIFILRCGDIYLSKKVGSSAAWLTNWGSVKAGNWEGFREVYNNGIATQIIDFSHIKEQPFHGAKSCAWIQVEGVKVRTAEHKFLENLPNTKIQEKELWRNAKNPDRGVEKRTQLVDATPSRFQKESSDYLMPKSRVPFRQGASIVPHCLVSVDPTSVQEQEDGRMEITTLPSRQRPWKDIKPKIRTNFIPQRWLINAVLPSDALPFCLRTEISKMIVPINADGELEKNPKQEEYWAEAECVYAEHKGKGKSTPQTLMARLNFNRGVSAQLPLRGQGSRIIYNLSGQYLRASRCPPNVLVTHSYYWYQPEDVREIPYLLALLNAACLQDAFTQTRKSDRHFSTYFWQSVPLPKYQSRNPDHQKLVELGRRAEGVAQRFANQPRLGQIAVSKVIRRELAADGVMGEIDAIVRKLLPRHTTEPSE